MLWLPKFAPKVPSAFIAFWTNFCDTKLEGTTRQTYKVHHVGTIRGALCTLLLRPIGWREEGLATKNNAQNNWWSVHILKWIRSALTVTRIAEKTGYKGVQSSERVQWPEERARKPLGLSSCPLLLSQWHTKDNWVPAGSQIHRGQICPRA